MSKIIKSILKQPKRITWGEDQVKFITKEFRYDSVEKHHDSEEKHHDSEEDHLREKTLQKKCIIHAIWSILDEFGERSLKKKRIPYKNYPNWPFSFKPPKDFKSTSTADLECILVLLRMLLTDRTAYEANKKSIVSQLKYLC